MLCIYRKEPKEKEPKPVFPDHKGADKQASSSQTGEGEGAGMNVNNSVFRANLYLSWYL